MPVIIYIIVIGPSILNNQSNDVTNDQQAGVCEWTPQGGSICVRPGKTTPIMTIYLVLIEY